MVTFEIYITIYYDIQKSIYIQLTYLKMTQQQATRKVAPIKNGVVEVLFF